MTKTKEELNQLKEEYKTLTAKLKELTEDELNVVTGGLVPNKEFKVDIRGFGTIGSATSLLIEDEIDKGNTNWKSQEEIPAEPGKYKIG